MHMHSTAITEDTFFFFGKREDKGFRKTASPNHEKKTSLVSYIAIRAGESATRCKTSTEAVFRFALTTASRQTETR